MIPFFSFQGKVSKPTISTAISERERNDLIYLACGDEDEEDNIIIEQIELNSFTICGNCYLEIVCENRINKISK